MSRTHVLLGEAEVGKFHVTLSVQQHVFGLEVAVHYAVGVQLAERRQHLGCIEPGGVLIELLGELLLQVEEELAALAVLEHKVKVAVGLEGRVELDDERVATKFLQHLLLRERVHHLLALQQLALVQRLDHVHALGFAVSGQRHLTREGAAANDLEQLEVVRVDGGDGFALGAYRAANDCGAGV